MRFILSSNQHSLQYKIVLMFAFAMFDTSMLAVFLSSILRDKFNSVATVGVLLAVKTISRLIFDIPLGIVADVFGSRVSFFISRILRITSTVCLIYLINGGGIYIAVAAVVSHGAAMSGLYGKIEAYMYNYTVDKPINFYRILSTYYLMVNFTIIGTMFIAILLLDKYGYIKIGQITLTLSVASLFILPIMPAVKREGDIIRKKFQTTIGSMLTLLKSPQMLRILIIFGITNTIAWQSTNVVNIVLIQNASSAKFIALLNGIHFGCMAIGSTIATISQRIFYNKIGNICALFILLAFGLSLPFLNLFTFIMLCIITIAFPTVQALLENEISMLAKKQCRATIISVGTCAATTFNVIISCIFGLSTTYISSGIFLSIVTSPALITLIFFLTKYKIYGKKG